MRIIQKLFNGKDVKMQQDETGILWFEIESLAMAIGYITVAKGKEYVHKSRMNKTLKNAEISTVVHGVQQWITEQQMYDFLIEAHTEQSKEFKKWLTKEVLPTIERTGGYVEQNREEEFINNYFPSFTEETKLSMVQDLRKQNEEYRKQISELEPKAEQFDLYLDNNGTLSLNQAAKALKTRRNKMMEFLRHKKVFNLDNSPSSYYADKGYFEVKNYTYITRHNKKFQVAVTRVTSQGQAFLYRYLKKHIDEYSDYDVTFKTRIGEVA